MAEQIVRPVCGLCRLYWHPKRDDQWHEGPFEDPQRDREYDHLCADCYQVVVEGEPETREWIERMAHGT